LVWRGWRALGVGAVSGLEKGNGYVGHVVEFALGHGLGFFAGLGEEDELSQVAEGSGAAVADAIGGEGFEDAFEGAMHIEAGIGTGEELGEFAGEIVFGRSAALPEAVELRVGTAEVAGGGGHAALAPIGELEVAQVVGIVLSSYGHGELYRIYTIM